MTQKPLLTTMEAARMLGVSSSTVIAYTQRTDDQRLRCLRLPSGHRRFRREDVEALIEAGAA